MAAVCSRFRGRAGAYLFILLSAPGGANADDYRHDFRRSAVPAAIFPYIGKTPQRYIRQDGSGLKIVLPPTDIERLPQTGVGFTPHIEGNFEITLGYEVARVDNPTTGYGSGAAIFILTDSPRKEAATLAALLPTTGGLRFVTSRHTTNADGNRAHQSKHFPAGDDGRKGWLRLIREGNQLRYLASTANDKVPKELQVFELGSEPVIELRLVADPGGVSKALEVTLTEFGVKADKLSTESERLTRSPSGAWRVVVLGVVLAVAAAGAFLLQRRRRRVR